MVMNHIVLILREPRISCSKAHTKVQIILWTSSNASGFIKIKPGFEIIKGIPSTASFSRETCADLCTECNHRIRVHLTWMEMHIFQPRIAWIQVTSSNLCGALKWSEWSPKSQSKLPLLTLLYFGSWPWSIHLRLKLSKFSVLRSMKKTALPFYLPWIRDPWNERQCLCV